MSADSERVPALPDKRYVDDLKQQLLVDFSGRDSLIRKLRRLRFMEESVDIPEAYRATAREVRTPICYEQVQRIVATLTVNYPVISVPPPGPGEENQRNSSKRERWINAALPRMEQEAERGVFRMFVDNLVADGQGVLKLVYKPEHWRRYPGRSDFTDDQAFGEAADRFKKSAKFPFALRDVDPLSFYPVFGEDGLEACLEITQRPRRLMARKFESISAPERLGQPLPAEEGSAGAGGTVEVVEYWDRWYYVLLVDGRRVRSGRHGYGQVPYFQASGEQSASRDPRYSGMSTLFAIRWLVPLLDSLLTMKQNAAFLYAYPTPFIRSPVGTPFEGGEDGRPQVVEWTPGRMIPLYPGEDPGFVQWQGTPPDLDELISIVRGLIDRAGLASVLYGQGPGSDSSGYMVNQLINAAKVKYDPIVKSAEACLERLVGFLYQLLENKVGEEVFVWSRGDSEQGWVGLSGDDIRGYYACKARIEPLMPTDDIAQGMFGTNLVKAGLVSKRWAREEKLGISNPEDMAEEILWEEAIGSQDVRSAMVGRILSEMGAGAPQSPAQSIGAPAALPPDASKIGFQPPVPGP